MPDAIQPTIGSIYESGNIGSKEWWVVDAFNPQTKFVAMTRLRWSSDLMGEPGVMFRTKEKIRFKNKGGRNLYSHKNGGFYEPRDPITLKP